VGGWIGAEVENRRCSPEAGPSRDTALGGGRVGEVRRRWLVAFWSVGFNNDIVKQVI
jgi:hypothetical protein